MPKMFFCPIFFLIFLWPNFSYAQTNHIVINSFQIAGEKSTDEFVELYNPTVNPVSLAGWRLSKKTSSGAVYNLLTAFPEITIGPDDFVVISHKDFIGSADLNYSTSNSVASDNTIIIFSDAGKTIVDKVGFGKAIDFEELAIPNPDAGEIWERKDGIDTNNNSKDFSKESVSTPENGPQNSASIFITELMPNPEGDDSKGEWIELYNSGADADIAGWVLSDKIGSVKKYTFPAGTKILANSYLLISSEQSGISLNNNGDVVELYDPSGNLTDDSGSAYNDTKEGFSYAYDGSIWVWTTTPTPGSQNQITAEEETLLEKLSGTKAKAKSSKAKKSTSSKKAKAPKANVLGETDENEDLFDEKPSSLSDSDRMLGQLLIAVALFGGIAYTIYVNREKLLETFKSEREGYSKIREKVWNRLKRWRSFFARR